MFGKNKKDSNESLKNTARGLESILIKAPKNVKIMAEGAAEECKLICELIENDPVFVEAIRAIANIEQYEDLRRLNPAQLGILVRFALLGISSATVSIEISRAMSQQAREESDE
ncbi:hypothetical protein [Nitrospira sp. BLG_1]|uniref:hypothetical protein n=1 Tax=Nitrospira sp. BLG_1 TaxID=3395883 RepID=UPI0039BD74AC